MTSAELRLASDAAVQGVEVEPAGALVLVPLAGGSGFSVRVGTGSGRVRVTVQYADGIKQHVHFFAHPDGPAHVAKYASFLSERAWYTDGNDAFHRAPAFLNWDSRIGHDGAVILEDNLAWIAGLSDECGAAPSVGMAMKNLFAPDAHQVQRLEQYVDGPLWGSDADRAANLTVQSSKYGVRASMFYSGKRGYDYHTTPCWDEARSRTDWRSYNYPHVTAVYWALYRLARNYDGIATAHTWQWYLGQAANTTMGMIRLGGFNQFGLMVGSVWWHLLGDLKSEAAEDSAWSQAAQHLEEAMHARAEAWSKLAFPFGSEMPWDSTGQEEVFTWCSYFGYYEQANATLDAVLAYMPKIPSWGYQGNGRRYFDFMVYGGEVPSSQTERGLHHYGSPLNAIPVLDAFRADPDDLHLLEVGLGGVAGSLINIDISTGRPSMAWHGSPQRLHPDPTSCDYGVGFFGHAVNAGAYLVRDGDAWRCFFCNLRGEATESQITADLLDSFRRRVFVAPLGLDIAAEAGAFKSFGLNLDARTLVLTFDTSTTRVLPPIARVHLKATALPGKRSAHSFLAQASVVRGAYEVPLQAGQLTKLTVTWANAAAATAEYI